MTEESTDGGGEVAYFAYTIPLSLPHSQADTYTIVRRAGE